MSLRIFQHCPLADCNYRRHSEGSQLTEPTQRREPGERMTRRPPLLYPLILGLLRYGAIDNQSFNCAFIVKLAKATPRRMALTACWGNTSYWLLWGEGALGTPNLISRTSQQKEQLKVASVRGDVPDLKKGWVPGAMGSCQQDFIFVQQRCGPAELWKQELLTGLFYDLVRMTFWTNFSPCADPLPTQEAHMYKAALICFSCPKGEIVMTGSEHRTVLTLLTLLTSSIAFILQWATRLVKVNQSPVTLSSHSKLINVDFLNVQFYPVVKDPNNSSKASLRVGTAHNTLRIQFISDQPHSYL